MKRNRFTEEQIIAVLREAESGAAVKELCRRAGMSAVTFYRWKSKFEGMDISEMRRLRLLEDENARLKRLWRSKHWISTHSRRWCQKSGRPAGETRSCAGGSRRRPVE